MLLKLPGDGLGFALQTGRCRVLRILGPGQPDFANLEGAEARLEPAEAGEMILVSVRENDDGEFAARLLGDVLDGRAERVDIALGVDAAVDQDVAWPEGCRQREQEAIAKPDPVHPNADRLGGRGWLDGWCSRSGAALGHLSTPGGSG